jgi:3-deoxy-D-manno-octulosonic-acid transferase
MQSKTDVERIRSLGAKKAKMIGNCKFDQAIEGLDANRYEWEDKLGIDRDKPTVVVGSTRGAEEEKFVLDALESIGFERFNVVHAPRHLERVDALAEQVKKRAGKVALRSKGEKGSYLILDTYGELSHVYSVADVVIVGGGFAKLGGQNIIQPLALGKPVLHGVNMQNFKDVAAIAEAAGASISCTNEIELGNAVRRLLQDLDLRERMGDSAREVVLSNSGASAKYAKFIAAEAAKAK